MKQISENQMSWEAKQSKKWQSLGEGGGSGNQKKWMNLRYGQRQSPQVLVMHWRLKGEKEEDKIQRCFEDLGIEALVFFCFILK